MSEEIKDIKAPDVTILIPECCREGWPDCPHVSKPEREKPNNIGL